MTSESSELIGESQIRWEEAKVKNIVDELLLTTEAGIGVANEIMQKKGMYWGGTKLGYLAQVYVAVLERAVVLDLKKDELQGFFDSQSAGRLWAKAVVERARGVLLDAFFDNPEHIDLFYDQVFQAVETGIFQSGRIRPALAKSEPNILFGLGRVLRRVLEEKGSVKFPQTEEEMADKIKLALRDDEIRKLKKELFFPPPKLR